jgi:hypothetical protein
LRETKLFIAQLALWLGQRSKTHNIFVPPSHQKFIQPVVSPQADFSFTDENLQGGSEPLVLTLHDAPLPAAGDFGTPLLDTQSWGLWESDTGDYTLLIKEDIPPRLARVDQQFKTGELFVDLAATKHPVYPPGTLEIRLFSVWLAQFGDLILHASGAIKDGRGYCFLGEAGAGKSTLARALAKDPQATILGEDTLILRYLDGQFWLFGTPWHLDPDFCSPMGATLEKLFFLDRSKPNGINLAPPIDGISQVLKTAVIPYYHPVWLARIMENLVLLSGLVPFFEFSYQLGADAWELIRAA